MKTIYLVNYIYKCNKW